MSDRTNALAQRLEQGAAALAAFASGLTDAEWQTRVPGDGRRVGVIVHHVASVYPLEIQIAQTVAAGNPVSGVAWETEGGDPRLVVEVSQAFAVRGEARPHDPSEERDEQQRNEHEELPPEWLLPEMFHQIGGPNGGYLIIGPGRGQRHRPGQNRLHEVCNCRSGRRGGRRVPGRSSYGSGRNPVEGRGRRE